MNLGELEISTYLQDNIFLLDPIVLPYIPNVIMKENLSIYVMMFLISLLLTGLLKFILYGYPKDGPLLYTKILNMMAKHMYLLNLLDV